MKRTNNLGIRLEYEIADYLNGKKLKELNEKWKGHILKMLPGIKDDDAIMTTKYGDIKAKPDLLIMSNEKKALLSIKSGKNPSVHEEYFPYFIHFLKNIGVSERTIKIISLYHYGTSEKLNNYGHPLTKAEIEERYGKYIKQANEELNKHKIIWKVTYRSIIKGAHYDREKIDYFYYGSLKKGILIHKEELFDLIFRRKDLSDKFIHFGELVYQPSGRSRDRKDYKYSRIHWPNLTRMFYMCEDENNPFSMKNETI